MSNRRTRRRRVLRLEGEALQYGGHLAAGLHACIEPLIHLLNSSNTLEKALAKGRAKTARRNYIETGSATRWGTCPRTMMMYQEIEGEPIYWNLHSSTCLS